MKANDVTIQMKNLQQYIQMLLNAFIKFVVLTLKSADEILWRDHSRKTSSAVNSTGTTCIYLVWRDLSNAAPWKACRHYTIGF